MIELVRGELRERGKELEIENIQIHRWRYSQPARLHDESFLVAEGVQNLVFAGDAFAGPKVEGAALSGLVSCSGYDRLSNSSSSESTED
jgi:predicted NAD/FAD-dependent oxidoreductase